MNLGETTIKYWKNVFNGRIRFWNILVVFASWSGFDEKEKIWSFCFFSFFCWLIKFVGKKFHGKNGRVEMSVASMSNTTTYSGTTTVTVTDMSRQSNISNTASNDAPMKGGPPQLDTLSEETNNSLKFDDINDLLAKSHSARHKDEDNRAPIHTGNNGNNENDVPQVDGGAPSVYVQSDSEDGASIKTSARGTQSRPSLEKVEENQQLQSYVFFFVCVCIFDVYVALFCLLLGISLSCRFASFPKAHILFVCA